MFEDGRKCNAAAACSRKLGGPGLKGTRRASGSPKGTRRASGSLKEQRREGLGEPRFLAARAPSATSLGQQPVLQARHGHSDTDLRRLHGAVRGEIGMTFGTGRPNRVAVKTVGKSKKQKTRKINEQLGNKRIKTKQNTYKNDGTLCKNIKK